MHVPSCRVRRSHDRYRFMTFPPGRQHRQLQRVLPKGLSIREWLLSIRRGRPARCAKPRTGKANKAWRILHRVTCVRAARAGGPGQSHYRRHPRPREEDARNATGEILRYFDLLSVRHKQVLRRLDQNDTRYQALADKLGSNPASNSTRGRHTRSLAMTTAAAQNSS